MPFITGRSYNVHWLDGLDPDSMVIHPAYSWEVTDSPIMLRFNYTDNREVFEVCRNWGSSKTCRESNYDYNRTDHCTNALTQEIVDEITKYL